MSRSTRKQLAKLRADYSGERVITASTAVGRKDLALDSCSDAQRRFRELFAHCFFNYSIDADGTIPALASKAWNISGYTVIISPRYDELVLINHAPFNVGCHLVPRDDYKMSRSLTRNPNMRVIPKEETEVHGIPGLRLEFATLETCWLRHIPTDARMRLSSRRSTTHWHDTDAASDTNADQAYGWWTTEIPLTQVEKLLLARAPTYPAGVSALVRGIVTRMEFADPESNTWANSWFWDPLKRYVGDIDLASRSRPKRRLTVNAGLWQLEWTGYPYAADIAQMLTDPKVGLPGATARQMGFEKFDLSYQGDVLQLRPIDHDDWEKQTVPPRRQWTSLLKDLRHY